LTETLKKVFSMIYNFLLDSDIGVTVTCDSD
jgi:hypothetical protein